MAPSDLLRKIAEVMEHFGLRYFITGSIASTHYGELRATNDIDVVVELPLEKVREFCAAFPADDYYASEQAARDAVLRHGQFNIIHPTSGLKIDVMVPTTDAFDASRLARRRKEPAILGLDVWFASPEDVILKKMDFFQMGGSEKHLRDIASILKIRGSAIDREYITHWVGQLGLEEVWQAILQRLGESAPPSA